MPVYEYQCKACGREFEYQQRMSDPEKTLCEACGEEKLERIISRTAFQLKGGGWYKDLYSSTKPEAGGGGDKKADAPAAAADKPAAKPDSGGGSSGGTSGGDSGSSSGGTSSGGTSSGGSSSGTSGTSGASTTPTKSVT